MLFKYLPIPQDKKILFEFEEITVCKNTNTRKGKGGEGMGAELAVTKKRQNICPSYLLQLLKATTPPSPGSQEDTQTGNKVTGGRTGFWKPKSKHYNSSQSL